MKKLALVLLLFPIASAACNTTQYLVTYKIDYQERKSILNRKSEYAVLYINPEGSIYVDRKLETRLKIMRNNRADNSTQLSQVGLVKFKAIVQKNYQNSQNLIVQEYVMHQYIGREEPAIAPSEWEISGDSTMLGYQIIGATGTFFGRKWKAWFSPEVPVSDGPYKFSGLPGLIFRLESADRHFILEISGIQRSYPEENSFKLPPFDRVSSTKFKERIMHIQDNPLDFMKGRVIFASIKVEGKEMTPEEFNLIARKEEEDFITLEMY